jgi:hypothetical protein
MFQEVGEFCLIQADGGLPTTLAAGHPHGESGVTTCRAGFECGLHIASAAA